MRAAPLPVSWHGDPSQLAAVQLRENVPGETVPDLAMARHGLGESRPGIAVPVMLGAMPNQHATGLLDSLDERNPFHAIAISATLRIPGRSPLARSA